MKAFGFVVVREEEIDRRVAAAHAAALSSLLATRKQLEEAVLRGECSAQRVASLGQEIESMREVPHSVGTGTNWVGRGGESATPRNKAPGPSPVVMTGETKSATRKAKLATRKLKPTSRRTKVATAETKSATWGTKRAKGGTTPSKMALRRKNR